ncbi:primase C-terminal domain-containing protein [Staphylococcus aureus]|nr:primase C-terminal domain-containing protein [Staphylococcus aureus]
MYSLDRIIEFIMHGSLNKYKYKHSKASDREINQWNATRPAKWKAGRVCVAKTKEDLQQGNHYIVSSEEALTKQVSNYTHWTPNPYKFLTKDESTGKVQNRTKDNIKQVNCFVVDLDANISYNDLVQRLVACSFEHEAHVLLPNMYVKTPNGWHLYYILDTPFYVKNENKRALITAEKIHKSLVDAISQFVPIDKNCLSMGFFRMPTTDNVVNFKEEYISSENLKQWSMAYAKKHNLHNNVFRVLAGKKNSTNMPDWVDFFLNEAQVESYGYAAGRNNVAFTLALYFKSIGTTIEEALDHIQGFNQRLNDPLGEKELYRTIKSAYTGKYAGASREHVETLLEAFGGENIAYNNSFVSVTGFYKFAKPREERVRSHYSERESDLEEYLKDKTSKDNVFLTGSTTAIAKALGMARSTFNVVINKALKNGLIIKRTIGKGRSSQTFIALKKHYMERLFSMLSNVMNNQRDKKMGFSDALRGLLEMDDNTKDLMKQNKGLYEHIINVCSSYEHMIEISPGHYSDHVNSMRFIS